MKILAIDLGEKKTGLAMWQEGFVVGAGTIAGIASGEKFLDELKAIIKKEEISKLVVGVPHSKSGQAAKNARTTIESIKKATKLPIKEVDETLTSKAAQERLGGKHARLAGRREDDEEAAKIILEDYLNQKITNKIIKQYKK